MVELGATQIASGDLPFSAIVGQAELKEALLATVANDDLDGLLVRGEKGTAKSTAVRGLASLLPSQRAVADCPYGCPPDGPDRQCPDCREREDPPVETRPVPLVTLPLGATRERVVGSLSVADALDGDYEFEPGLLARANRGILYVDEVNLLDDHLVDVLLDAAASGVNRVERDSVSVTHPAEFTLVGTMNPEEGDLRPQLRDRFALQATVTGCEDVEKRVAIVDRALGREGSEAVKNGAERAPGEDADAAVRERLLGARERLDDVSLPDDLVADIARLCRDAGVDGHRGDIAIARAARTLAALDGRTGVLEADVERAAELALPHRLQSRPFEDAPDPEDVVDDHFDEGEKGDPESETGDGGEDGDPDDARGDGETDGEGRGDESERRGDGDRGAGDGAGDEPTEGDGRDGDGSGTDTNRDGREGNEPDGEAGGRERPDTESDGDGDRSQPPQSGDGGRDSTADSGDGSGDGEGEDAEGDGEGEPEGATPLVPGESRSAVASVGESAAPEIDPPEPEGGGARPGSRTAEPSTEGTGARVRARPAESETATVDAAASVRAAASRGRSSVHSRDLRESVRVDDASALVVFAVDASASMRPAMRAAKGTVLELLKDAYERRDEVAFVAFAGDDADVLLPPTDSVTLAARHLKELPTGDRTPLPAGLDAAGDVIERADPTASTVVLVTDGRANAVENPVEQTRAAARRLAEYDPRTLVVDAGTDDRATLTDLVLDVTEGDRVALENLSADLVDAAAGAARQTDR